MPKKKRQRIKLLNKLQEIHFTPMTRPLSYHDLQNYEQPRETKQEFDLREIRLKANQEIMELRKARERYVPHAATQK
jgi:hypothetical protein